MLKDDNILHNTLHELPTICNLKHKPKSLTKNESKPITVLKNVTSNLSRTRSPTRIFGLLTFGSPFLKLHLPKTQGGTSDILLGLDFIGEDYINQMELASLNSPTTFTMTLEVLGNELQFAQDPNSKHLGTTVWDASLVFVKFLEKNCRRARFSLSKMKGKRVIELGAGCGVAGFGMALLGCDVVMTDQVEVLPLLMRNVERNTSMITQMNSDSFGSIQAAKLSWGNEDHIRAVGPPFDYIIGTDVMGYENRSTSVHEQMLQMWKRNFQVKTVPNSKMDSTYQHPDIQLYVMILKPPDEFAETVVEVIDPNEGEVETGAEEAANAMNQKVDEVDTGAENAVNVIDQKVDEAESCKEKGDGGSLDEKVEED